MTNAAQRVRIQKDEAGAVTIDQSIENVDTMLDEMDGFRRFDSEGFNGYVAEQMKAAEGEEGDVKKARLTALRESMETAKSAFAEGGAGKARIKMYAAAGAEGEATETEKAAAPAPVTMNVDVIKSVIGSLRHEVNKADGSVVPIAKMGEARATLDRLASAFGLLPYEGETEVSAYRISWEVQDAVCALGQLAEMDQALALIGTMTGVLGALAPAPDVSNPVPDGVAKSDKTPVAKSANEPSSIGAITDSQGWPFDMNAKK